jgi:hypothetical protein
MWSRRLRSVCILSLCLLLAHCGLSNPQIAEIWDADYPGDPNSNPPTPPVSATAQIEFEIKKQVYCELKEAVYAASHYPITESDTLSGKKTIKYSSLIPPGWSAQIALSLQVDESTALNPGVTFNQVLQNATTVFGVQNVITTPQSFSLGLGGTVSSTATRIDKFNPEYSVEFLAKTPVTSDYICDRTKPENDPFRHIHWNPASSSPFLIESDLGIKTWLLGAMFVNAIIPSDKPAKGGGSSGSAPKTDSVSYEIKFVIVSNGNITPTWKLVRFSANTGSLPLLAAGRTRTHDLIITLGVASQQTNNAHLASQIGSAVASANRALLNSQ